MTTLRLVLVLALRSLVAHRVKSVVVGGLLFSGTFLVVLGHALLDSVESGMERAITGSLAGHLQVHAADARDPLSLFGGFGLGSTDIGELPRFEDVKGAIGAVPGVRAVVPMGVTTATVFGRNEIDQVLAELREAIDAGDAAREARLVGRARKIVDALRGEAAVQQAIATESAVQRAREALDRAASDAFWAELAADPEPALELLETRIAPLASDGRLLYLSVIGTDPERFAEVFDRFKVIDGQPIPPGRPGFLFSKRTYEQLIKNPVAAELDRIAEEVADGARIADDPLLQERIARNARQYRRITFQLDPDRAEALDRELAALLPTVRGDLDARVQAFLTVDDETLSARRDFFYERIAPHLRLYEVPVGGTITLRGFTRSGYLRAVEVPVWGTYEFTGLEEAGLAAATNLVDLVTFRELYGKMSDGAREELAAIKEEVGVADVGREDAEALLFGGGGALEQVASAGGGVQIDLGAVVATDPFERTYPPEELQKGLVLNAAIVLDDPRAVAKAATAVADAAARAGLDLKVLDWKEASGTLGQLVIVLRLVLYVALSIIFLVALIIVNNAMVMATLDRVPEIGTLRAIGAQRSTVLALFLLETALLGLFAGGAGALAAVGLVTWLGAVGIPAPVEQLVLVFGGPRLFPSAGLDDVAFGLVAITTVAVASTLYPATLAARVPPIVAMQGRE